jgi:hypothetical protein
MQVTQEMIDALARKSGYRELDHDAMEKGLQAVLDMLPDLAPLDFTGHPVYFHKPCSAATVLMEEDSWTRECIENGDCDCDLAGPWLRLYAEAK